MSTGWIWIVACEFAPFPGGQATYAREISLALHRAGKKVVVIAPAYRDTASDLLPLEVRRVLAHQELSLRAAWAVMRELRQAKRNDVILTCDIRAGLMVSLNPLLTYKTRVAMFHGGEILRASRGLAPLWLNRLAVTGAHRLVANSSFSATLVDRFLRRPCDAIPLGVAEYWYGDASPVFESAVLASVPASDTIVCLVARLEPRKGHLVAIEAMKRRGLHHRPGFKFVFAGRVEDEAYAAEVRRQCDAFPQAFVYAGEICRNDVRLLYKRSRALVLAAQPEKERIEGFGLVITEAAAQGCPAVSTRVGGIVDALQHERTGFLYAHDDIDGIGDGLLRLLEDTTLHACFADNAREFARSLTWDGVAQRTFGY